MAKLERRRLQRHTIERLYTVHATAGLAAPMCRTWSMLSLLMTSHLYLVDTAQGLRGDEAAPQETEV